MNRRLVNKVRTSALLLVVPLLAAACGAPATNAPTANTGNPTTAPTSAPAAATQGTAPTAAAAGGAQATTPNAATTAAVTLAVGDRPSDDASAADKELYQSRLDSFAAAHPEITIDGSISPYNPQAFAAKVTANTLEDLHGVWFSDTRKYIDQGIFADITDVLKEVAPDYQFNPSVLQAVQDGNGRIYGVPENAYALALVYNRKLFKEAGLDPDNPPRTWTEVREAAKKLTNAQANRYGFSFLSTGNQGGWHFTTLSYSFGGNMQEQSNGKWTATFNDERSVAALQALKDMRWTDKSMPDETLIDGGRQDELFASGQIAMMIGSSDAPASFKSKFNMSYDDVGITALPQQDGNATLGGGYGWMFRKGTSPEQIRAGILWTLHKYYDPASFEAYLKKQVASGNAVGLPTPPLLTGASQQRRQELISIYANVPSAHYTTFFDRMATIAIRNEPPIETQQMYAALDTVVQAVLTDQNADPKQLLDAAATQFQTQVLNQVAS